MSDCLREKALAALLAGGGSTRDRAHLAACPSCAARYRELECDMARVAAALRVGPPHAARRPAAVLAPRRGRAAATRLRRAAAAEPLRRAPASRAWRWASAAAAALALIVAVATRDDQRPDTEAGAAEISAAAREVSAALFDVAESGLLELPRPAPAHLYASAALAGGWPCGESGEPSWSCDAY